MRPRGVAGGADEADRGARGERGAGHDARLQVAEVAVDVLGAAVELDREADSAAPAAVRVGVHDDRVGEGEERRALWERRCRPQGSRDACARPRRCRGRRRPGRRSRRSTSRRPKEAAVGAATAAEARSLFSDWSRSSAAARSARRASICRRSRTCERSRWAMRVSSSRKLASRSLGCRPRAPGGAGGRWTRRPAVRSAGRPRGRARRHDAPWRSAAAARRAGRPLASR